MAGPGSSGVEQRTENPRVGGSIPPLGTMTHFDPLILMPNRCRAQLVEGDASDAKSGYQFRYGRRTYALDAVRGQAPAASRQDSVGLRR